MERDKEEYAKLLAKRAERAIKILKILVAAFLTVFAALAVYAITVYALTAFEDIAANQGLLIGFIVFMACIFALVIAVFAVLAYAYYNLNKLKKLE